MRKYPLGLQVKGPRLKSPVFWIFKTMIFASTHEKAKIWDNLAKIFIGKIQCVVKVIFTKKLIQVKFHNYKTKQIQAAFQFGALECIFK